MAYIGEIISLIVAASWTVTALFADKASHRLGSMTANVLRLFLAVIFLAALLWLTIGYPYPVYADADTCKWLSLPLKGILLGIGAGLGQGVGLVLSKIGLAHYTDAIPADAPAHMAQMLPFASTMIRAIVGTAGFLILMAIQKDLPRLGNAVKDRGAMGYILLMTIFGPVIGVSLSLMAVQYTNAGIASTLMALTPVLILFPYAFVYKQRIRLRELVGVAVSMLGVALFFLM